nr:phage holin family protein [uncultured Sphingorhabdus sp.]
MSDDTHANPPGTIENAPEESDARTQIAQLAGDVRQMLDSEMRYYRTRFEYTRGVVARAAGFGAVALGALLGAAIALVVGILLILSSALGPIAATVITVVAFGIIGAFCGYKARNWVQKVHFPEIQKDDE